MYSKISLHTKRIYFKRTLKNTPFDFALNRTQMLRQIFKYTEACYKKGGPSRQGYVNTLSVTKANVKSLKYLPSVWLKVLQGNTDSDHTEGRILDPPIVARFIKINIKTFQNYPSLRVELYGCRDGMYILLFSLCTFCCRSLNDAVDINLHYLRVVIKKTIKGYLFNRLYANLLFTTRIHYLHLLLIFLY